MVLIQMKLGGGKNSAQQLAKSHCAAASEVDIAEDGDASGRHQAEHCCLAFESEPLWKPACLRARCEKLSESSKLHTRSMR